MFGRHDWQLIMIEIRWYQKQEAKKLFDYVVVGRLRYLRSKVCVLCVDKNLPLAIHPSLPEATQCPFATFLSTHFGTITSTQTKRIDSPLTATHAFKAWTTARFAFTVAAGLEANVVFVDNKAGIPQGDSWFDDQ